MRTPVLLLVAITCLEAPLTPTEGRLTSPARVLKRRRLMLGATDDVSSMDCGGQTSLCADCTSVLTCTRLGEVFRPLTTTTCPTATPYCEAGACVPTMPNGDCIKPPVPSSTFVCNGNGYFPDPASCLRYYLCVDGVAYPYDCSSYTSTRYSHAKAMCVPTSEQTICSTVTCNAKQVGEYQPYNQDGSVYFVCQDNTAANAYVAACPEDHQINAAGTCTLSCLREGRIVNADDNTKYYECIRSGNTYTKPLPLTCPTGSTFDKTTERCTTGSGDHKTSGSQHSNAVP